MTLKYIEIPIYYNLIGAAVISLLKSRQNKSNIFLF